MSKVQLNSVVVLYNSVKGGNRNLNALRVSVPDRLI